MSKTTASDTYRFAFPARVLVLSSALPPDPAGQAFVLYRWLEHVDPSTYQLQSYTPEINAFNSDAVQPSLKAPVRRRLIWEQPLNLGRRFHTKSEIPADIHAIDTTGSQSDGTSSRTSSDVLAPKSGSPSLLRCVRRRLRPVRKLVGIALYPARRVARRGYQFYRLVDDLVQTIRRDNVKVVFSCSGNPADIPVSIVAGAITGVPVVLTLFDEWVDMMPPSLDQKVYRRLERLIMKRAARTIVSNEKFARKLRDTFDIPVTVVPNATDRAAFGHSEAAAPWPVEPGRIRMLYAGSLNHSQLDAVVRIDEAMASPLLSNVTMDIYLANGAPPGDDISFGPAVTIKSHIPAKNLFELERQADILVIPLGFFTRYPALIQTAAPTKVGEYLASGRPILVHAPAGSWIVEYVREHECGIAVDQPDSSLVRDAILEIISNQSLRDRMMANAQERAQLDFMPDVATERLISITSEVLTR